MAICSGSNPTWMVWGESKIYLEPCTVMACASPFLAPNHMFNQGLKPLFFSSDHVFNQDLTLFDSPGLTQSNLK